MKNGDLICDRCGCAITDTVKRPHDNAVYGKTWRTSIKWAKFNIWEPNQAKGYNDPKRVDLCCECYDEFTCFMDEINAMKSLERSK